MSTSVHIVLVCLFIIMTMANFNKASRIQRIEQRLSRLENRLDTESKLRREDMSTLFDKLDRVSSALNISDEDVRYQGQQGINGEKSLRSQSSQEISELCTDWRRDLMKTMVAFKDVKDVHAVATDIRTILNETTINQINLKEQIQYEITDLKTMLNESNVSHGKLKEHMAHEITELKEQLLQMEKQINKSSEMIELKNLLNELNDTCNSLTESSAVKIETTTVANERFESCVDLYENGHRVSGQYDVYPDGRSEPIRVYCDQSIETGGGWTVFQRRKDGSENFYRGWMDYKLGFGSIDNEFWLGNEHMATLTSTCCSELRIDMQNTDGVKKYAVYKTFQIKSASERYRLKVDGFSGNVDDSLEYHNGQQFTTKDLDNGGALSYNCAIHHTGAWWYDYCLYSSLNAQYGINSNKGIYWRGFREKALTFTEMKFRRLF